MRYLKLHNYIDIVNTVFPEILDYAYKNKNFFMDDLFINFRDSTVKKILKNGLLKYINDNNKLSEKHIYINTCEPKNNWRKDNTFKDHLIYTQKYTYSFKRSFIEYNSFNKILNKYWNALLLNKNYLIIEHRNLDYFDLDLILTNLIGEQFIIQNDNYNGYNYCIMTHIFNRDNEDIPDMFVREVKQQLEQQHVI
jgi:hypothetical protein